MKRSARCMDLKCVALIPAVPLVRSGLSGCLDDIMLNLDANGEGKNSSTEHMHIPATLASLIIQPQQLPPCRESSDLFAQSSSRSSSSTTLHDEQVHSLDEASC